PSLAAGTPSPPAAGWGGGAGWARRVAGTPFFPAGPPPPRGPPGLWPGRRETGGRPPPLSPRRLPGGGRKAAGPRCETECRGGASVHRVVAVVKLGDAVLDGATPLGEPKRLRHALPHAATEVSAEGTIQSLEHEHLGGERVNGCRWRTRQALHRAARQAEPEL